MSVVTVTLNEMGLGKVILDGQDISNIVTKVSIEAEVGEPTRVRMELLHIEATAELEGAVMTQGRK